jgi:uncharacterized radical SAM superfamily protein
MGWEQPELSDLENLIRCAWAVREHFHTPVLSVAAPGSKHYDNNYFSNHPFSFANVSITGRQCACKCEHCKGKLLQGMVQAENPADLGRLIDKLIEAGCKGILISGGANNRGEVPLLPFMDAIAYARTQGLKVLVHTGLVNRSTAGRLAESGVNQVVIDVIGNEGTIKEVYHLDRQPSDYLRSMQFCREAGLKVAPHVVIGLHYGRIVGEMNALRMIQQIQPEAVVLVVLMPLAGTAMASVRPPNLAETARIIAAARIMNPFVPVSLGCARPAGEYTYNLEKTAIDCGVNCVAYPSERTLAYAGARGLQLSFSENCCGLGGDHQA